MGPCIHTRILVLIDHHTRWVELCPLLEPTEINVPEATFRYWTSRWDTMRVLLSHNGPQFLFAVLRQVTEVDGTKKAFSSPDNPRGNSIAGSYMRALKSA